MQRWSLILSAYDYTIKYVFESLIFVLTVCHPLPGQPIDSAEKVHVVVQTEELPVTVFTNCQRNLKETAIVYCYKIPQTGSPASYLDNQLNSIAELMP